MQKIVIDKDFQYLLPVLDEKTYSDLEADILKNGIRDPLVLWGDILIDGYNRHSIAIKHDLLYMTVSMEFTSRDDVVIWIINNQIVRRNLTPYQLRYFRGLHFHAQRRSQGNNNPHMKERTNCQNGSLMDTAKTLAEKYKVSPRTIARDSRLADALITIGEVSPEAKQSILLGETKLTRNEIESILSSSEHVVAEIAETIENGTFEERRSENIKSSSATNDNHSLESAFLRISNQIQRELSGLTKTYMPSEVKTALRGHIKTLEDIYKQL